VDGERWAAEGRCLHAARRSRPAPAASRPPESSRVGGLRFLSRGPAQPLTCRAMSDDQAMGSGLLGRCKGGPLDGNGFNLPAGEGHVRGVVLSIDIDDVHHVYQLTPLAMTNELTYLGVQTRPLSIDPVDG
jgi:hypothetical protein